MHGVNEMSYIRHRCAFLPFIHRHEHSRLVSIILAMETEDYDQNTQIITEVGLDVKLNKWHIAMEKLYRQEAQLVLG